MSPVSVCVCTYKRAASLALLLQDLAAQEGAPGIGEVIVVDNHAQASARTIVESLMPGYPVALRYAVQPEQNIALARNLGLQMASGEWIALIDDDERAPPDWLSRLASTAENHQADGVFGPVIYELPPEAPAWLRRYDFYAHRRDRTGHRPKPIDLYTNNVLIRRATLCSEPGPFDPRYGLTGGSDVDLMGRLHGKGAVLVWCDEAEVRELVERERLSARWILRRHYRGGQNYAALRLAGRLGPISLPQRIVLALDTLIKLVATGSLALLALVLPKHRRVWAASKLAIQCGKLTAFFGGRYEEYRHVRGPG